MGNLQDYIISCCTEAQNAELSTEKEYEIKNIVNADPCHKEFKSHVAEIKQNLFQDSKYMQL